MYSTFGSSLRPSPCRFPRVRCLALIPALAGLATFLSGCGSTPRTDHGVLPTLLNGNVHGGQQPVVGSRVYFYAVSSAKAGPATSLLGGIGYVISGLDGSFSIKGDYMCPANSYVYLLAIGGDPGLAVAANNSELALGAGLGSCEALSDSDYYTINAVTTVAMASSLKAYASSETEIGSATASDVVAAFANVKNLIDPEAGTATTFAADGSGGVPRQKINSLANALAACVNSDGSGSACSMLMSAANVHGANGTPIDTFQAALNIAQNPDANVATIYDSASPDAVFVPALDAAPTDWTVVVARSTFYPATPPAPPSYTIPTSAPPAPASDGSGHLRGRVVTPCAGTCGFMMGTEEVGGNSDGAEFLQFANGNFFGYFAYESDRSYVYHFDLGYEYIYDAGDGNGGVYLYDLNTGTFWFTSPSLFPYMYDYTLGSMLYYYPDPNNQGRYDTNGVRYFYDFTTGQAISK
jgi:hypothetical protein